MDNRTWILVADASQAKIYSAHKASLFSGDGKKLTLVSTQDHPAGRLTDQDLVTDRQGKFGSGTFVEPTDPKKHEEEVFAMSLVKTLHKGHGEGQFKELIFIAPATLMGMINKHLPNDLKKLVQISIEKDYTRCTENEIVKHLQPHL